MKVSKTLKQALAEKSNNYASLEENYKDAANKLLILDPNAPPLDLSILKLQTATIIIPAFNVRSSILACLASIENSSFNLRYQNRLQVVVVDDGSTDGTLEAIKESVFSLHLTVVHQLHHGRAHACNTGASVAEGDIFISCDADMVLSYFSIEHLMARHQRFLNALLIGFRSDTPKNDPRVQINFIRKKCGPFISCFISDDRIQFPVPGWPSNMCLVSNHLKNLGEGKSLWMPDNDAWSLPDLLFGTLFSIPKDIYFNIGGYDERFYGWGCEDGYLAAKAIAAGQYIIPVYAASGLHISHPPRSKTKHLDYLRNRSQYFRYLDTTKVGSYPDWFIGAKKRIIGSFTQSPIKSYRTNIKNNLAEQTIVVAKDEEIDCLLAAGQYSQAYTSMAGHSKMNENKRLIKLSKTYLGMNRYQDAINILEEASKSSKLVPESTVDLAVANAAIGQFKSANTILKKLSEQYPQTQLLSYWFRCSAQMHISQGRKYFDQGFQKVALRCFEAALIVEPRNSVALKYRYQCLC